MLYKARNEAIKFYDDYSLIMSEAKSKAKQNETKGTGLLWGIFEANASKIPHSTCTSKSR